MSSLGRYTGAGAFLVPLYGSAELPQAFCRSAVRTHAHVPSDVHIIDVHLC